MSLNKSYIPLIVCEQLVADIQKKPKPSIHYELPLYEMFGWYAPIKSIVSWEYWIDVYNQVKNYTQQIEPKFIPAKENLNLLFYIEPQGKIYSHADTQEDKKQIRTILVIKGTLPFQVNNQKVTINAGDVFCFESSQLHESQTIKTQTIFSTFTFVPRKDNGATP